MTLTKELRRILDERGVKWCESFYPDPRFTRWESNGVAWNACEVGDGILLNSNDPITPEDVIAATVGTGMLTAEQVREAIMSADRWRKPMGDTGMTNTHLIIRDDGWQAIADELNATVGAGTCRNISKVTDTSGRKVRFVCSECDAWIDSEFIWNHEYSNGESPWVKDCKLNYCPNCGRRIVEEEAE